MGRILLETLVRAPVTRCFDLARDVDAHTSSLADTGERAIGATHALLEAGDEVTWEARHFGIRLRLTARVTAMDRPAAFRDDQVRGPFAWMRHVHRFVAMDGATIVGDDFEYRLPLGWLGELIDALVVRRHLRELLARRALFLKRVAEDGPPASGALDR